MSTCVSPKESEEASLDLLLMRATSLSRVCLALRRPGWQVSPWTVTVGTAWVGAFSVDYSDHVGTFGLLGGSAAILWSVLFAAVTRRSSHHLQQCAA
jgi:hypothetical protein